MIRERQQGEGPGDWENQNGALAFRDGLAYAGVGDTAAIRPSRLDTTEGPRRILLYGLNFHPEPTGVGKYTGEMAQWLARAGHEVRVITSPPYYPYWKVDAGYRSWRYTSEQYDGFRVMRAPLWVPKVQSGVRRVLHLFSFAISSLPVLLRDVIVWRPDVVLCVAPAMACAPGAAFAARVAGAMSWLHIQDFEVDAAFDLGMLKGKSLRNFALHSERAILRSFDRVSSLSRRMVDNLRAKGVSEEKAKVFPNWVDVESVAPMERDTAFRHELGIPADAFVAMYSGTMGAKQGLEVMAAAARRLEGKAPIHFVFCGQGPGKDALHACCAGIPNVHWLPLQPEQRLSELLSTADVHLLPQQRAAADLVLPSKLTGMLASGRPVLATAEGDTELANWVDGCGCLVAPGDDEAMARALFDLYESPERCRTLGACARRRAVESLSRDVILREFVANMEGAIRARA
jgi:colanic acid biosynthesis glycosyl transferase WcaI